MQDPEKIKDSDGSLNHFNKNRGKHETNYKNKNCSYNQAATI